MLIAAFSAAAVSAEFVGGKATRDALFLTALDITALPAMLALLGRHVEKGRVRIPFRRRRAG
jgi:hypothetical protein